MAIKQSQSKKHLMLMRPGFEDVLKEEFSIRFKLDGEIVGRAAVAFSEAEKMPKIIDSVFARQYLPRAMKIQSSEIHAIADCINERIDVMSKRGNRRSNLWTLHAFAIDDDERLALASKISKLVLAFVREKHKELYSRYLKPQEFTEKENLSGALVLQIYVPKNDEVWFSIGNIDEGVSKYAAGFKRMKTIQGAPSRSASKLEEALALLGNHPKPGDTAVDLGAAPGGWSLVLAKHGAHVKAVDHGALSIDSKVKILGSIEHVKENGLKFKVEHQVDWLVCDMVMGAKDTIAVFRNWHSSFSMKHFVFNVKLSKSNPWKIVSEILGQLDQLKCSKLLIKHLFHDRSEITIMGDV